MADKTIQTKLEHITKHILLTMKAGSNEWDINCGWCEEWALGGQRIVGGELKWLDELGIADINHCVLVLNWRFHDAQHPTGIDQLTELDIVRNMT